MFFIIYENTIALQTLGLINQRAPADHQGTRPKNCVDLLEDDHGQVVALKMRHGRGFKDAGGDGVDARKRQVDRDTVQSFLDGPVDEREPLMQDVDRLEQGDRAWRASHGTTSSLSLRMACRRVILVDRSKPFARLNCFMPP